MKHIASALGIPEMMEGAAAIGGSTIEHTCSGILDVATFQHNLVHSLDLSFLENVEGKVTPGEGIC